MVIKMSKLVHCCTRDDCPNPSFTVNTQIPESYVPCYDEIRRIMQWGLDQKIYKQVLQRKNRFKKLEDANDECCYQVIELFMTTCDSDLPWFIYQRSQPSCVQSQHLCHLMPIWASVIGEIVYDVNLYFASYTDLFCVWMSCDIVTQTKNKYNRTKLEVEERLREIRTERGLHSEHPLGLWQNDVNIQGHCYDLLDDNSASQCQNRLLFLINTYVHNKRYPDDYKSFPLTAHGEFVIQATRIAIKDNQRPWYALKVEVYGDEDPRNTSWMTFMPHFNSELFEAIVCWRFFESDMEFMNRIYEVPRHNISFNTFARFQCNSNHPFQDQFPEQQRTMDIFHFRAFYNKFAVTASTTKKCELVHDILCIIGGIVLGMDEKNLHLYYLQKS